MICNNNTQDIHFSVISVITNGFAKAQRIINIGKEIINDTIDEAYKVLPYRLWILFMCYFLLKVRRPIKGNPLQNFENKMITEKEKRAFEILVLEMRNRIKALETD